MLSQMRSCDKILISFRTHFVLNCTTSRSMLLKDATTAVLSRNNSLCLCLLYSAKWLIYWCKRVNNKAELPITGRYINTEYMVSNWSQIYWYRIYGFKADLPHHRYIDTEYMVLKLFSSDNFIMTTSISDEIVSFSTLRSMVTKKPYYQIIIIK